MANVSGYLLQFAVVQCNWSAANGQLGCGYIGPDGKIRTSAAMKANVLSPPNRPTPMQTINMTPESVRIADSSATRRKWDQPGVVTEKESWKKEIRLI